MRVLRDNDGNHRKTAMELGIGVSTIRRYKQDHYGEYLKNIVGVGESASEIESKRLGTIKYLSGAMEKINGAFILAVEEAIQILTDEEKRKKLPARDLVQLINVLAPYVAEKKSIVGVKEPDTKKVQYNQFITNIMAKMKTKP